MKYFHPYVDNYLEAGDVYHVPCLYCFVNFYFTQFSLILNPINENILKNV